MADNFKNYAQGLTDPATAAFSITPDDASDLAVEPRAIAVAQAGIVRLIPQKNRNTGATVDVYVAAGVPFPLRAIRVLATGTTATGIVGLE